MFATLRRLTTTPGQVAEVARLIEEEYVPLVSGLDGYVSYTLLRISDEEVASLGVFTTAEAAEAANAAARSWTRERIAPLAAGPLEALAGPVVLDHRAGVSAG